MWAQAAAPGQALGPKCQALPIVYDVHHEPKLPTAPKDGELTPSHKQSMPHSSATHRPHSEQVLYHLGTHMHPGATAIEKDNHQRGYPVGIRVLVEVMPGCESCQAGRTTQGKEQEPGVADPL